MLENGIRNNKPNILDAVLESKICGKSYVHHWNLADDGL